MVILHAWQLRDKSEQGLEDTWIFTSEMAHEAETCVISVEADQTFAKVVGIPKSQSAETMNVRFVCGHLFVGVKAFAAKGATIPKLLG